MANAKTNAINASMLAQDAAMVAMNNQLDAEIDNAFFVSDVRNQANSEIRKANAEIQRLDKAAFYWMDVAQFRGDASGERKAINAGLRAVIRYALSELRKSDPNNPLLDKKVRDRIFAQFEAEELKKLQAGRIKEGRPLIKSRVPEERYTE